MQGRRIIAPCPRAVKKREAGSIVGVRVAVVGGTGYAGGELLRILYQHEGARVTYVASRSQVGQRLDDVHPYLTGCYDLSFDAIDPDKLAAAADVAFLAVPHGASMELVPQLLERGMRVVDLGADFRLADAAAYEYWYKAPHTKTDLLAEAVYGLPEMHREQIRTARLVANPGCYPTAVLLAAAPLVHLGVIDAADVTVSAVTGVSGAGGTPGPLYHYPERTENVQAYGVPGHRHTAEMEQGIGRMLEARGGGPANVTFVPHLVPMSRGILATLNVRLAQNMATKDVLSVMRSYWRTEPFVKVLGEERLPTTKSVAGSNFCHVTARVDARTGRLVVLSAIDNLVKGAAGQAIQNMNIMYGLDETTGLKAPGLYP